jgi:tetratricopeptide (TPR) repeat protein
MDTVNAYDFRTLHLHFTVVELKAMAKDERLTGYSKLRKDELIDLLWTSHLATLAKADSEAKAHAKALWVAEMDRQHGEALKMNADMNVDSDDLATIQHTLDSLHAYEKAAYAAQDKADVDSPEFEAIYQEWVELYWLINALSRKALDIHAKQDIENAVKLSQVESAHAEALEIEAERNEAYQVTAENAGLSITDYLTCRDKHIDAEQIFLSVMWIEPIADKRKVVVFDGGTRVGVSAATASYFTGEVYDMPKGEITECQNCKETILTVTPDDDLTGPFIAPSVLNNEMINALSVLLAKAEASVNAITPEHALYDSAYQVMRDLQDAMGEAERTKAMMEYGDI